MWEFHFMLTDSVTPRYGLELQQFTEIVSYPDTFSDDTHIVSRGRLTIP